MSPMQAGKLRYQMSIEQKGSARTGTGAVQESWTLLATVWGGFTSLAGRELFAAKKIVAAIKESKLKAQASIQGDTVRVVSKDRDVLQQIISKLRAGDYGVELQFSNYRTN